MGNFLDLGVTSKAGRKGGSRVVENIQGLSAAFHQQL